MSSSVPGWVTTLFCPLLGTLISNAVGLAPVRAVLDARKNKKLGTLSPIPFALITNSCLGWVMYGVFKGDYFIFFSNCFSLLVGFALCLTAVHILEKTENSTSHEDSIRIKIESILMMSASFWIFIIFLTGIVLKAPQYAETSITIVGAFCIISSLVFYGAPLINMVEIVRLKDSSSLYGPALCVNGLSCFLWFFYGLIGVNAVIVWLPNIIGLLLVCVELAMCCIYPAKRHKSIASISEVEPTYDYAVYSSSRHMSSADLVLPIIGMESEKSRAARSSSKARNMLFSISEKYPMSGLEENKMDTEEYEENPYYSKEAMKSRPLGNNSETQSA